MFGLLLGADVLMAVAMFWKFPKMPPQIPLFFSLPTGEDQLSEWWMIFLLPFLVNTLYFFNIFVGNTLFRNNPFVKSLIRYLNIIVICVGTYIYIRIILLVT